MPKALEQKLRHEANTHRNWSQRRKDAYVYGALRNTGWRPQREASKTLGR